MKTLHRERNYFFDRSIEPHPDQLHVVEANEFLPHLGRWTIIGGGVLFSLFVAAVSLTSILNFNVTVKVDAAVRPAGELRLVQSAIAGTIKNIEVEESQEVTQGQVIARLDDSRLQTQKSQLASNLNQGLLQINQIDAQLNHLNDQIVAEVNLITRTIIAAQAELDGIQRNYQDQQTTVDADLSQAEVAFSVAKAQLNRLRQEKVITATVEEAEAALKLAKVQRDRLQPIVKSGAISRSLFEEKEQAVKSAKAKLEQAKASAQDLLEEKEQAVKVAQTNLTKAKTAINPSNASITMAAERIKQERAKGEATLAALKKERQTLLQQRINLQKQLEQTAKELQQVEIDLTQSVIRAPISGTLLQLNLRNPGQVMQPSEAIAQIAPENAPLRIKAKVRSEDIDKVKPGQQVQMQVSACPYPDYGTLKGIVTTVAPDALPQAKNGADTSTSQPVAYEVNIQPTTSYVGKGDRQCRLKSGMEGRADIISRQETVLKFILRKARLLTDF